MARTTGAAIAVDRDDGLGAAALRPERHRDERHRRRGLPQRRDHPE